MNAKANTDKVQVTLNGVAYTYRLDMGALLVYEQFVESIPEELRKPQRLAMVMHYACMYGSEGFSMSFDEFCAAINTIEVLNELRDAAAIEEKRWQARNIANAETEDEKNTDTAKKK